MDELIERLRKILEHERRTGCGDVVVSRGLEGFLHHWSAEAVEAAGGTPWQERVRAFAANLPAYRAMQPAQRAGWIANALAWLKEGAGGAPSPPAPLPPGGRGETKGSAGGRGAPSPPAPLPPGGRGERGAPGG
ncbi:MAG: hypothetical protein HY331_01945, partial [Chloroflexi bacterium]|nr:hypothetical protein [Chloroflexota bacterium]